MGAEKLEMLHFFIQNNVHLFVMFRNIVICLSKSTHVVDVVCLSKFAEWRNHEQRSALCVYIYITAGLLSQNVAKNALNLKEFIADI